jgi:hypothetical protein
MLSEAQHMLLQRYARQLPNGSGEHAAELVADHGRAADRYPEVVEALENIARRLSDGWRVMPYARRNYREGLLAPRTGG